MRRLYKEVLSILKLNLAELAQALAQSDVRQGYIDIEQGTVVLLDNNMDEEAAADYVFDMEDDWEHYLPLPNAVDEHERHLMQEFAASQEREGIRTRLLQALAGPGGAVRFHHQVKRLLLLPSWEAFWAKRLLDIARDLCEENGLEYEE